MRPRSCESVKLLMNTGSNTVRAVAFEALVCDSLSDAAANAADCWASVQNSTHSHKKFTLYY